MTKIWNIIKLSIRACIKQRKSEREVAEMLNINTHSKEGLEYTRRSLQMIVALRQWRPKPN